MAKRRTKEKEKQKQSRINLLEGMAIVRNHRLFSALTGYFCITNRKMLGNAAAIVDRDEKILVNEDLLLSPQEWAYVIAHCRLHLAFGHFDEEKLPGIEEVQSDGTIKHIARFDPVLWNTACDIYIAGFLEDIRFGRATFPKAEMEELPVFRKDEKQIYDWLLENSAGRDWYFGTGTPGNTDMRGLEHPITNRKGSVYHNDAVRRFGEALADSVAEAVGEAGGHGYRKKNTKSEAQQAADWFINHYPLLGGLAAGFTIVESRKFCEQNEISVAAVNVPEREIYVNPSAGLAKEELKFVLAHEYLHAGLEHHERCLGRDPYLWNIACDFVINGWLSEMQVGKMPENGILYDPELSGCSAEEVYDRIVTDIRKYKKLNTFRGYGKGDVLGQGPGNADGDGIGKNVSLDEFCKSALQQGLEYHLGTKRGVIPAGLAQEIRALSMPPIPWDVELGRWFDTHFAPLEKRRTYARPSRRQGSTPDIPRPRYVYSDILTDSRTFGVIVDTSGSMNAETIGYALGAIASYSASKEVPYARVIFCDARAYDAGYVSPDEIAGRVEVIGRGGTILQPGVSLLEKAEDFPKDAPILIITDGMIEPDLSVKREHAYLLPKGRTLPFRPKGEVFRFSN